MQLLTKTLKEAVADPAWVQSQTIAARYGNVEFCVVDNGVYMGTVNNSYKTSHVCSVQCGVWVLSTIATRRGMCVVYHVVYGYCKAQNSPSPLPPYLHSRNCQVCG